MCIKQCRHLKSKTASYTDQTKVVNQTIANGREETLVESVTEQVSIIVVRRKEGLVQEGKGDDGVDVEHHQTEDGHPQQGNACMWREGETFIRCA